MAEAKSVAAANGGELRWVIRAGDTTKVRVRWGEAEATAWAKATRRPPSWADTMAGAGGAGRAGLVPELLGALGAAERLLGRPVPVVSGFRSHDEQARLWAGRASNPYPVAPPGSSAHERGRAVDVPAGFVDALAAVASRVGLCHPYPKADPVHFELCGR